MNQTIVLIGRLTEHDTEVLSHHPLLCGFSILSVDDITGLDSINHSTACAYLCGPTQSAAVRAHMLKYIPAHSSRLLPLLCCVEQDSVIEFTNQDNYAVLIPLPLTEHSVYTIVSTVENYRHFSEKNDRVIDEAIKYQKQKYQLIHLSTALSAHYDLKSLLSLILLESCDIVNADAGSIYIRERRGPGKPFIDQLRFKVSLNNSVTFAPSEEFTLEIDENRIAGYVALTGETLILSDVYNIDKTKPYRYNTDLDERFGYRSKSMITVPLRNREDMVVGVLQLMNKKRNPEVLLTTPEAVAENVIDFVYTDQEFLLSIGSLVAVSIERTQLYQNIEQIFEGFLSSSIEAIDARDQVTAGHSWRVSEYAMALVDEINKCQDGAFAGVTFNYQRKRQFKFAALLHDIGKIGVPEALLTKESRLSNPEVRVIASRFDFIRYQLKHQAAPLLYDCSWKNLLELDEDYNFLKKINLSGSLSVTEYDYLSKIRDKYFTDTTGQKQSILTDDEWKNLSILRGNLTDTERVVINSHAQTSFRILSQIPWTPDLEKIPSIAAQHHEMIDGSGYPHGLDNSQLSLESKILTIVDIYDALVALDRPYKPALSPQKALEILKQEAEKGRIDQMIVDFFIEKEVYNLYAGKKNPEMNHTMVFNPL
ncbi:MAG: HD domain-containing protein [Chitinivibrionales bacterium]|nr:HD domain-containing protein [Chitinivibrionales bacterium]